MSGSLNLAQSFQGSSILQHKSVLNSSLLLNKCPRYGYTRFCWSTLRLMDIQAVCTFQLLWAEMLCTLLYGFLYRPVSESSGYGPLGATAGSYSYFMFDLLRIRQTISWSGCHFTQLQHRPLFSLTLVNTCLCLITVTLVGVKSYLILFLYFYLFFSSRGFGLYCPGDWWI